MCGSCNIFVAVRRTLGVVKNVIYTLKYYGSTQQKVCISPIFSQFIACVPSQMPFHVVLQMQDADFLQMQISGCGNDTNHFHLCPIGQNSVTQLNLNAKDAENYKLDVCL